MLDERAIAVMDVTTDANFRAWGQAIHDALLAVGLVNTADTGQIDLTTVASPGVSAYAGYEIWRFDDADQGTYPVFFKIEYGHSNAVTRAAIRVTTGTGSNGSGTITNPGAANAIAPTPTPSASGKLAVCFTEGGLCLINEVSAVTNAQRIFLVIERLRDPNGDVQDLIGVSYGVAATSLQGETRVAGAWVTTSSNPGAYLDLGASYVASEVVVLGGRRFLGRPTSALRSFLWARDTDIAVGDEGDITIDGVAHTYKRVTMTVVYGLQGDHGYLLQVD